MTDKQFRGFAITCAVLAVLLAAAFTIWLLTGMTTPATPTSIPLRTAALVTHNPAPEDLDRPDR